MDNKQKVLIIILTAIISTVVSMTAAYITTRSDKINCAAPIDYVDQKDKEIITYVDTRDNLLHKRVTDLDERERQESKEFQSKIDDMHDKIIDIWKTVK